jgi:hypothetical protein
MLVPAHFFSHAVCKNCDIDDAQLLAAAAMRNGSKP